ncbi:MAG: ABC transporter permease [Calditrichaceae bacterium]|nr:ABC transporter permease [Calditrichaceae bacterium]MBN2709487.1 ABC transporter permease [Calditrichaceae bacterium]RQV94812.1 MAG: FtsX-like permease family protein [Calditrichota bacterium]
MIIRENLDIALTQLKSGKMRSFLTTTGITIGIATVIFIVAVLEGYNKSITDELNVLGANVFQVQKRDVNTGVQVGHGNVEKYRKDLKRELAQAIRQNCDLVEAAGAEVWIYDGMMVYKDKKTNPNLWVAGGEPEFFINNGYYLDRGRVLTDEDIKLKRRVIVLGYDAIDILFPFEDPIGKYIKILGTKFQVIGILEKMGNSAFGQSKDNTNCLPITTFEELWGSNRSVNLTIRVKEGVDMTAAQNQVIGVLRKERKVRPGEDNDFAIFTNDTLIDSFNNIAEKVQLVAMLLGLVSLLVGSIGVMNIMLVTVTERTREIGIRKAIGAKKNVILTQFLSESVLLSIAGGILGLLFGLGFAALAGLALSIPFTVPVWVVIGSILVTSFVGLGAGMYPASRAARMDPINALRYE